MLRDFVTVLWVASGEPIDASELSEFGAVEIAKVSREELPIAVRFGRTRGGVLVVGNGPDLDAASALGADAVLGVNASHEAVRASIRTALARADARLPPGAATQELGALALLAVVAGVDVEGATAQRAFDHRLLEQALPRLADFASRVASSADLKRLLAIVNASTIREIQRLQGNLSAALRTLATVVGRALEGGRSDGPEVCDLRVVVAELATVVHRDVERVGTFTVELPDLACVVPMSAARAMATVCALLNNAVAAIEAAERSAGTIGVRVAPEASMIVVEITDNGTGMTPDVRRDALNPFFTTRRSSALGLGLTMAALNVRRAGGEIMIDSEPDEGTSVRLFLPCLHDLGAPSVRAHGGLLH